MSRCKKICFEFHLDQEKGIFLFHGKKHVVNLLSTENKPIEKRAILL